MFLISHPNVSNYPSQMVYTEIPPKLIAPLSDVIIS